MRTYRLINDEIHLAEHIREREQRLPRWFHDLRAVWTPTFDDFLAFWRGCREIYGLFEDDKLLAVIYLEYYPAEVAVHVSVIEPIPHSEIIRFFRSVRIKKRIEGVDLSTVWTIEKNRPLIEIAEAVGYRRTGLKMDYGESRGRLLRWVQMVG